MKVYKKLAGIATAVAMTALATVGASASGGASMDAASQAMVDGLTSTQGAILLAIAAIIPIGLVIFGAKKGIEFAKKFFNKVSG